MSEVLEIGKPKIHSNGYFPTKAISSIHEFYLTGEIGPAEDYLEWFDAIRHASETDAIKIYINSFGGDLFTAIQFLRVLSDTSATVVCSVEGACMSAGWFWASHGLNHFADNGDCLGATKRINGGTIGLADRLKHFKEYYELLK